MAAVLDNSSFRGLQYEVAQWALVVPCLATVMFILIILKLFQNIARVCAEK